MTRTIPLCIAVGIACAVVSGVHAQARSNGSALIGTWAAAEASGRVSTLKFSTGGLFEVEFAGDNRPEVSGRYKVVSNELLITDEDGLAACLAPEYGPGRYSFTIRAEELTLGAVKDDCDGRVMILERRGALKETWTKKK
jgi:hypothetical protein